MSDPNELAAALQALDGRRVRVELATRGERIAELVGALTEPAWSSDGLAREIDDATLWLAEGRLLSADDDRIRVGLAGGLEVSIEAT